MSGLNIAVYGASGSIGTLSLSSILDKELLPNIGNIYLIGRSYEKTRSTGRMLATSAALFGDDPFKPVRVVPNMEYVDKLPEDVKFDAIAVASSMPLPDGVEGGALRDAWMFSNTALFDKTIVPDLVNQIRNFGETPFYSIVTNPVNSLGQYLIEAVENQIGEGSVDKNKITVSAGILDSYRFREIISQELVKEGIDVSPLSIANAFCYGQHGMEMIPMMEYVKIFKQDGNTCSLLQLLDGNSNKEQILQEIKSQTVVEGPRLMKATGNWDIIGPAREIAGTIKRYFLGDKNVKGADAIRVIHTWHPEVECVVGSLCDIRINSGAFPRERLNSLPVDVQEGMKNAASVIKDNVGKMHLYSELNSLLEGSKVRLNKDREIVTISINFPESNINEKNVSILINFPKPNINDKRDNLMKFIRENFDVKHAYLRDNSITLRPSSDPGKSGPGPALLIKQLEAYERSQPKNEIEKSKVNSDKPVSIIAK